MRRALANQPHHGWCGAMALWLFALLVTVPSLRAASFVTPVTVSSLDYSAYSQWVDGVESSVTNISDPTRVLYTQTTVPNFNGFAFGETLNPGPRHLRIGFNAPTAVGSVLVRGSGKLSVLAPGATYPGSLTNEADWIPAWRLATAVTNTTAGVEPNDYGLWVLPPGTTTRALRFSHTSDGADQTYAGRAAGAYLLADRWASLAPQATVLARTNQSLAYRTINEHEDLFNSWDNGFNGGANVISATNFEWVILSWQTNVTVGGVCALWAGFSEGEVQVFTGPASVHPRNGTEAMWSTVVASTNIQNQYPWFLGPNFLNFGSNVTTRALRLKMNKAINEATSAGGLIGSTRGGKRVWLGDLLALQDLGGNALESAIFPHVTLQPPIPVPFFLDQAGYVTLVIEDPSGKRVRNLIGETFFPAGSNVVYWDGLDESGRVNEGQHGEYEVQGALVAPGNYKVRGLRREAIDLRYEFTVYNAGTPPWLTPAGTGGWLADHTPPSDLIYIPTPSNEVLISSFVAEDGDALVWVTPDGQRTRSKHWIGGTFTGASHLARDRGPGRNTNHTVYTASSWEGALRLYSITATGGEEQVVPYTFAASSNAAISGLAVYNGNLIASLQKLNQLLFAGVASHSIQGTVSLPDPRGLTFQTDGNLLVLTGSELRRYFPASGTAALGPPTILVTGLDDPQRVTVDDATGNIYVSLHGASHVVRVFSSSGTFLRDIGVSGVPSKGPYNPQKMHHPMGMTIVSNQLWVAEEDYVPKRVSVWGTDGTFIRAHYGTTDYGGGGSLDPIDKTKFRYRDDHGNGALEFQLDWATGTNVLVNIYDRPTSNDLATPTHSPQIAFAQVFGGQTNTFLTDAFTGSPVGGRGAVGLWQMRNGQAKFVACVGLGNVWSPIRTAQFNAMVPPPGDLFDAGFSKPVLFAWTDLNDDGQVQTNEVQFRSEAVGVTTINQQFQFATVRGRVFSPASFTSNGVPIYDLSAGYTAATNFFLDGYTTGSGEVLHSTNGWTVTTGGPLYGMSGGSLKWTYPSQWPSLLAAVNAPVATKGGQLIGTTRLLGPAVRPRSGEAGDFFAVNGDFGQVYLLTTDGLFLSTLFKDSRTVPPWSMPAAVRNMSLNDVTLQQECFWPTLNQTADGEIYFVAGHNHASIVRVDGLTNVARLATNDLLLTTELVTAASEYQAQLEAFRQSQVGYDTMPIQILPKDPVVDGQSNDWSTASLMQIDSADSAAIALSSNYLYAAYWSTDTNLFVNTGVSTELLFKTGGALDLMLATNPDADPARTTPVTGDLRLVVTKANGAVKATLYRAVVPGSTNPVPFSSPYRTIYFDRVEDVSAAVQAAKNNLGFYEFRIPLATLGFSPTNGMLTLGDVGVLHGAGGATIQRVYWHNKSTGLAADIPTEAELTPNLWGRLAISSYIPPVAATPFEAWRNANLAPWELASTALSGPYADPDGDSRVNLIEYAGNTDPRAQNLEPLPQPYALNDRLTISYTKVKSATDLRYTVEVSSNLFTWLSGSSQTTIADIADHGPTQTITVCDLFTLSATPKRFMRLKVDKLATSLAVSLTAPQEGNFFIAPANISLAAEATSGNSFINRVEFFNGATKIGESTAPLYTMVWTNIQVGSYTLKARATDNLSNVIDSLLVNIQVLSALPFISFVADQVINEDTVTAPIPFTIADADTPVSNLVLSATSSNLTLVPNTNITLGGSGTNRTVTVRPATNQFGSTPITLAIFDGNSTITRSFLLTVNPVNDAPFADAQSLTTAEDTVKAITLTGSDVENSPLTFALLTSPAHGSLSGTAPNLTYLPATNYFGADSFTFRVGDGSLTSAAATVSITVTPENDAPVANPQNVDTIEDFPIGITLTGSDVENSPLTYAIVTPPAHGSLVGTAPNLTYTPASNYFGNDSFTFKVNDGQLDSAPATVNISLIAVNDAPVANAQSVATLEDTITNITLTGFDVEGSNIVFSIVSQPTNGFLTGTAPNLVYHPNTNFEGSDSFTFRVNDGQADSLAATVSITVIGVNDAPIANGQAATTPEDTTKAIVLTGFDVEGTPLNFTIVMPPTNGTLSGTAPNVTYRPATNFFGIDSFAFRVDDGQLTSAVATVAITVTPVNDAPVAVNQSLTNAEDAALAVTLSGFDVEGTSLQFTVVAAPTNGTLSGTPPNLTYLPNTNFFGGDSFTFRVSDGQLTSAVATVSITVTPVNDAPVAFATNLTATENQARPVTLAGFDLEGSNLVFTVLTAPTNGTLTGTPPTLTYLGGTNFNGADSFTFKVNDGELDSTPATVTLTVSHTNYPPIANAQSVTTAEDTAKSLTLTGADLEGSNLVFTVLTAPTNGTLSGTAPNLTYLPATNFFGSDSLTFKVNDGDFDSAVVTVSITITPVNDAPVAFAQSVTATEDIAKSITLSGFDLEGSNLTFIIVSGPTNGALTGTPPNLTYLGATNFNGADSFTFKVNDGTGDSTPAAVSITVLAQNDPPAADAQPVTTTEDTAKAITLTGSDPESTPLGFTVLTQPTNGTLSGAAPNLTYLPATNFFGTDSFTFKSNDGTNDSAPATVSITVTPVNDAPVANAQAVSTPEDTVKAIILTGFDLEGSNLAFTVVTSPTNGSLTGTPPNLNYRPATNFFGTDSFTFRVNDGGLDSVPATVTITVTSVNDAPTVSLTLPTNNAVFFTPTNLTLTANANDVDGSVAKVEFFAGAAKIGERTNSPFTLTWTNPAAGDYALTAVATDNGGLATTSAVANASVIFFRGINLGSSSSNVVIEGRQWMGMSQATSNGFAITGASLAYSAVTPNPSPDPDTASMIRANAWKGSPPNGQGFSMTQTITNGTYKVYVWTFEDFQSNFRNMDVKLEGTTAATNIGNLNFANWQRFGPYSVTVTDGVLNIDIVRNSKGDPTISGIVIVSPNGNSGAP